MYKLIHDLADVVGYLSGELSRHLYGNYDSRTEYVLRLVTNIKEDAHRLSQEQQ